MIATHRRLASIAAVACCAVTAGGALASQASAATLVANHACYVNARSAASMTITGAGWVPGATVQLVGGATFANATADASGNLSFTNVAAPQLSPGPGAKTTTLTATATNPDGSQAVQTLKVRSANRAVELTPNTVNNLRKDKVTFFFSGFTPGKHIYGYYLHGKKVAAKDKFGKATGPCGVLKQKALLYPGGRPKHDVYTVTFENSSHYSPNAFPRVTGQFSLIHF